MKTNILLRNNNNEKAPHKKVSITIHFGKQSVVNIKMAHLNKSQKYVNFLI